MTTYDCSVCGKPTSSHQLNKDPPVYVCHACFILHPDKVAIVNKMLEDAHIQDAENAANLIVRLLKLMKGIQE